VSLNEINLQEEQTTKHKIFMAAARLFADKGYNGVSMREISELSGMSKPTIYYYFGNKEGIYEALVNEGLKHSSESFQKIRALAVPVRFKLTELIRVHFRHCLNQPEFTKFSLSLFMLAGDTPFLASKREQANQLRRELMEMIQEGKRSGEFGPTANPKLAAEIFLATFAHFFWRQQNTSQQILTDQLAEEIVEFLFKGLNE